LPCRRSRVRIPSAASPDQALQGVKRLGVSAVLLAADPDSERYANGAALPGPNATLAGPTFEEWLDTTVPAGRA
jgi:hypothetical protein